jgi:hypothetical protein
MLPSVKTLLSSIVDYAGLFPPATLDLPRAMAHYAHDKLAAYQWMIDRFVLPVSRLDEFAQLLPQFPLKQWSLSVIVPGESIADVEVAIAKIQSFQHSHIRVAALEFPPLSLAEIEQVLAVLPTQVEAFFELPWGNSKDVFEAYLKILQQAGASAKIRTGGMTANLFPSASQLCQFIFAAANAQVRFKATAGLHHPFTSRSSDVIDLPAPFRYGFLNLAILAALVYWQKVSPREALEVLTVPSPHEFQFAAERISWKTCSLNLAEIDQARQRFFRSFGSCSFQVPVHDLKELKLL